MDQYPPNSHTAKPAEKEPIERVTTAEATRRKQPLGKKFKSVFIGGDAQTTIQYVMMNVLLPAVKDMLVEAGSQGIERLIYGDSARGRRPASRAPGSPMGHVNYSGMSRTAPPRQISARARQQHDFDEIVLTSRGEAADVLDRMYDILSKYHVVTVADLYALTGLNRTHVDEKWGWDKLTGADVRRVRDGYLLNIPAPEYLD